MTLSPTIKVYGANILLCGAGNTHSLVLTVFSGKGFSSLITSFSSLITSFLTHRFLCSLILITLPDKDAYGYTVLAHSVL